MENSKPHRFLISPLAFFLYGVTCCALVWIAHGFFLPGTGFSGNFYEQANNYRFIDPLLTCADISSGQLEAGQSQELKNRVGGLITELKAKGEVTDAGVNFRQLHDGPRFDINGDIQFQPGSLLKVPLAMSVYKEAEGDPALLTKEIEYTGDMVVPEEHFTAPTLEKGKKYSVEELVRATLQNSDNSAAYLLGNLIGINVLDDSYSHLGVTAPTQGSDYATTVNKYASFFRILYTATYLSHSQSEHLLSILSTSAFTQGLTAGVPEGVTVAHKFGERSFEDSNIVQLHDCGIVYAKNNPYLLCVMLRGTNFDRLAGSIKSISSLVYNYVD